MVKYQIEEIWREFNATDETGNRIYNSMREFARQKRIPWTSAHRYLQRASQSNADIQHTNFPPTQHEEWLKGVMRGKKTLRFVFLSDMHIPEHDPAAIELACKIIEDHKPDVIQVGSDMFDFDNISRHDSTVKRKSEDALVSALIDYRQIMANLRTAAPQAIFPYLIGNHDIRLFKWLSEQASQVQDYVTTHFIQDLKDAGAIWVSPAYSEYKMGSLYVLHGYKANIHTAHSYAQEYGADVVAGHTHRPDIYIKRFRDKTAHAFVSGCLCNLQPKYSNYWTKWRQGLVLFTLDLVSHTTHGELVVFQDNYRAIAMQKLYALSKF